MTFLEKLLCDWHIENFFIGNVLPDSLDINTIIKNT